VVPIHSHGGATMAQFYMEDSIITKFHVPQMAKI